MLGSCANCQRPVGTIAAIGRSISLAPTAPEQHPPSNPSETTCSPRSSALATPAPPRRSGYLPSLDGWRALAILAVIMDHDDPWSFHGYTNAAWHQYGGWGVNLFFAISGLLVCTRILQDEHRFGRFRVRDFYIRRLFRIQPAALVYVAAIALLGWLGITHERTSALLGALFLYQNYLFHQNQVVGQTLTVHFWTLAVEEHFYLLLSLLLLWFKRWRAAVFVAVLALLFIWQRLSPHFSFYNANNDYRYTEFVLQFLLFPALVALLLQRPAFRAAAVRWLHPWVAFLATLFAKVAWSWIHPVPHWPDHPIVGWFVYQQKILLYAFTPWVLATMLHPHSWTTRFLELPPLRFLGRLSYSLYLWHVLFFASANPVTGVHAPWLLFLSQRPWRYLAAALMALLSYFWVEKPLIRLGHRLAPPATPGHRDLRANPAPGTETLSPG